MQHFNFYVDRKITTWMRERHDIMAESKEEAIKLILAEWNDNECEGDTFIEQERMYDTDTPMDLEDNNGNPTCELYFNDEITGDELIIDNLNNTEL
jgi:hypothetical protein